MWCYRTSYRIYIYTPPIHHRITRYKFQPIGWQHCLDNGTVCIYGRHRSSHSVLQLAQWGGGAGGAEAWRDVTRIQTSIADCRPRGTEKRTGGHRFSCWRRQCPALSGRHNDFVYGRRRSPNIDECSRGRTAPSEWRRLQMCVSRSSSKQLVKVLVRLWHLFFTSTKQGSLPSPLSATFNRWRFAFSWHRKMPHSNSIDRKFEDYHRIMVRSEGMCKRRIVTW